MKFNISTIYKYIHQGCEVFSQSVMITTIHLQNSFHFPNKLYPVNRDHPLHPHQPPFYVCLYEVYYSYVFK